MYVNGEPPTNGMSNVPTVAGRVVVAVCTVVMVLMAVAQVAVFLRLVVSAVFSM